MASRAKPVSRATACIDTTIGRLGTHALHRAVIRRSSWLLSSNAFSVRPIFMKLAIGIGGYSHEELPSQIDYVVAAEALGVDTVWSAEGWGEDAVTSLAYLAARTKKIQLGTGIMQISARVPAMTAMTAQSMAMLSGNRFLLGLGTSGPQVVEGLHGVPYRAPLTRLRENVEIIRLALSGEKLTYTGTHHQLPLPNGEGKALRLSTPAVKVPIYLATLGPRALHYTGAAADGWLGASFSPDFAEAHLAYLRAGAESAGRTLADIDKHMPCFVSIGDDLEALIEQRRPQVAFSLGAMGSQSTNFYNDAFRRAGFEDDARAVQELWLAGKREQAIARVPDILVTAFGAVGTPAMVQAQLQKYKDIGMNTLVLRFASDDAKIRLGLVEQVVELVKRLA